MVFVRFQVSNENPARVQYCTVGVIAVVGYPGLEFIAPY